MVTLRDSLDPPQGTYVAPMSCMDSTDVMHLDGEKFLATVCELLQLTIQCRIKQETQNILGLTLQGQLELLRSRGFIPTTVHTDPQSVFRMLVG
jgi:hypothetical protein